MSSLISNLSTLSKEELVNLASSLLQENIQLKSKTTITQSPAILFSDYIIYWLHSHKTKVEPTTYDGYDRVVMKHIVPYFKTKNLLLPDLTVWDIEEYYHYKMSVDRLSANTIHKHHANIRSALKKAKKNNLIAENPALLVDLPPKTTSMVAYYNADDLMRLLFFTQHHYIYPAILLTALGLRKSEALGVTWDNINFKEKTIEIRRKVVSTKGHPIIISEILKTKSSYRKLVLPDWIITQLYFIFNRQVKNFQDHHPVYSKEYLDFVCVNDYGKLMKPDCFPEVLSRIIQKHRLKKIDSIGLRHTCATLINSSGFNLKYIKEWLGHSTIQLTANTYTHITLDMKKEIANALNAKITSEIPR